MNPASQGEGRGQNQGDQLRTPRISMWQVKGTSGQPCKPGPGRAREESYLEASSFDASVEFIILSAPAPEAVGHPVALTQRHAVSVTCPSSQGCALSPAAQENQA